METDESPDDMILCATGKRAQIDRYLLSSEYWMLSVERALLQLKAHADTHPGSELSDLIRICLHALEQKNEIPEQLPIRGNHHAFIVLGHALTANGELSATLLARLVNTLSIYDQFPLSTLIVSGFGPPNKNPEHCSEAFLMQQWLLKNGIPREFIVPEDKSIDTVQNVLYSTRLLVDLGCDTATVVTSQSHLTRAVTLFRQHIEKVGCSNKVLVTNCLSSQDLDAQTTQEKLWMLKDIGRILGVWKYRN